MDDLTVLITGSGGPGIVGTIFSLKNNMDKRNIKIIGTDVRGDVIGKYICDKFYKISRPSKEYISELLDISIKEKVNVIIPQNTMELFIISKHKKIFEEINTKVMVSDSDVIELANNKYNLMKFAKTLEIPIPHFGLAFDYESLHRESTHLGYPYKCVVVKPLTSNGSRGVRIIDDHLNYKERFYSDKVNAYTDMKSLVGILGEQFPPLLVMEYLPGNEYTADILQTDKFVAVPRIRKDILAGITFVGETEENHDIIEYSKILARELKLKYAFGFQFKLDENGIPKLLECNPRVQGTMVLSTLAGANIIYASIKNIMGEQTPSMTVDWGVKIFRYWGGLGITNGMQVKI